MHRIQVGFQNLALAIDQFDLQGRNGFLELAGDGWRTADFIGIKVAGQLLGKR